MAVEFAEEVKLWARVCAVLDHDGAARLVRASHLFGLFSPEFNGRLLALVREAWGDETLGTRATDVHGDGYEIRWHVDGEHAASDGFGYGSEAEALVTALEAAP